MVCSSANQRLFSEARICFARIEEYDETLESKIA
jgi:hypothetical protein